MWDQVQRRQAESLKGGMYCLLIGSVGAVALSLLVGGCSAAPAGLQAASGRVAPERSLTGPGFPGTGLTIDGLQASARRLVGAEGFELSLVVREPAGRQVKAYGIRTPYETSVHPFRTGVPMAIPDGAMRLQVAPFQKTPVAGEYPFEFWLVNESGLESNRLQGQVTIQ